MSDFDIPKKQVIFDPTKQKPDVNIKAPNEDPKDTQGKQEEKQEEKKEEKPKYSKEELLQIFDEIIFSGEYTESFHLRGRLEVKFRTRTAEEVDEIQSILDGSQLNLISSVEQRRSILILERALVKYGNKDLSGMKPSEKTAFIKNLAAPVIGMLMQTMNEFDNKVFAACREGEENF